VGHAPEHRQQSPDAPAGIPKMPWWMMRGARPRRASRSCQPDLSATRANSGRARAL
jgi:hypothetical protein